MPCHRILQGVPEANLSTEAVRSRHTMLGHSSTETAGREVRGIDEGKGGQLNANGWRGAMWTV
eukprot:3052770-Alexandrium_andersonii.AAC.1